MFYWIVAAIVIFAITFFVYKFFLTGNYDYFERKGLKYVKPYEIFTGNIFKINKLKIQDIFLFYYRKHPNQKLVGVFQYRQPIFYVTNPEILKTFTVKDFAHFQDHRTNFDPKTDELFGNMLPVMKGKQWREMRIALTPAFTGSKMRLMLQFINKCAHEFTEYICEEFEKGGPKPYVMKKIFTKYTNDVIASCAFGVECNSLKHPENEIYTLGQEFLSFQTPLKMLKFVLMTAFPRLSKSLGLRIFHKTFERKFREIILETMEVREKNGIVRPDMINILMNLIKASIQGVDQLNKETEAKRSWTEKELVAQCFVFFLAGFEPSSTIMAFAAYELAVNPDIQDKLIAEIDETNESLNGQSLTYEALQKMKYLDMVISEVLRKWPTNIVTDRICVQDYDYEDTDGLKFTIEKGSIIWIPIYAFHMDPTHFPEPEKFNPERFSDENSANLNSNAYIPFGIGPRNCIGSRFALMEAKAIFYHILLKLKITVCEETQVPLKLKPSLLGLIPEKDIKLQFEPRY